MTQVAEHNYETCHTVLDVDDDQTAHFLPDQPLITLGKECQKLLLVLELEGKFRTGAGGES
jgi:hypothetical protein